MRIAVPLENNLLASHFGHCQSVAFVDVDPTTRAVMQTQVIAAPPHEHGALPRLIAGQNAQVVIAGGIGPGAVNLLAAQGIEVVAGAPAGTAADLVAAYLNKSLVSGDGSSGCNHHCGH